MLLAGCRLMNKDGALLGSRAQGCSKVEENRLIGAIASSVWKEYAMYGQEFNHESMELMLVELEVNQLGLWTPR